MNQGQALKCFAALAQEHRLAIVRLLVKAGEDGIAAGLVAEEVGIRPSNFSAHAKELENAGLITQRREGRSIIYAAEYQALSDLLGFLMKDCCAGHPEICAPAIKALGCLPAPKRGRAHA